MGWGAFGVGVVLTEDVVTYLVWCSGFCVLWFSWRRLVEDLSVLAVDKVGVEATSFLKGESFLWGIGFACLVWLWVSCRG